LNSSGAVSEQDVYNPAGQVLMRYNGSGGWTEGEVWAEGNHLAIYANGQTYFPITDQVGTERARFASTGGIVETCMSQPFGDNLQCTGTDSSPYKFGKLERDTESGDDHAQHRDYNSNPYRWLTPDPDNASAQPSDPQTWNMYAYVRNNPTTITDPDGLDMDCRYGPDNVLHCTVYVPRPQEDFPKAIMALGAIALPQEELGPWMPVIGGGLLLAGWCMQTNCVSNLANLFSQSDKTPPPPATTSTVSNTASPNPDPNQQKGKPDEKKKADDQIRASQKRSPSYHSEYGQKTYGEIKDLAKAGDQKARQMKKLIEQAARLGQRNY
jgi:RHS repeat-associated protein